MHLTPGAPHAETGSGDVLTVRTLAKIKETGGCFIPADLHRLDSDLISSILP